MKLFILSVRFLEVCNLFKQHISLYIFMVSLILFSSCDVHQWPDTPDTVKFHLELNYDTQMTQMNYVYQNNQVIAQGGDVTYVNALNSGTIRYIIRVYQNGYTSFINPSSANSFIKEITLTRNLSQGYDYATDIELPQGDYKIMVWSDLAEGADSPYFYNPQNFAEIKLMGTYRGNTNYRDAFRGTGDIRLVSDILANQPDTLSISMQRPLAKYEFITNDLKDFITKESVVDTEDYNVVFLYAGFMPNTYNMFSDSPTDSYSGVMTGSRLNVLNANEASLGFDYVFTGLQPTSILIQIGLYDNQQRQVALSEPINVPLKRGFHTILKGSFLMQQTSGGIYIKPEFDGNHNIINY